MIELNFDEKGFLMPYQGIEADLETLEYYFVDQFPDSNTRRQLFINYLRYTERFKSRITRKFTQWINGSYVSLKKNPKDIDFVVFFDYEVYEAHRDFLDPYWCFSLEQEGLDAYLIREYPPEHPFFVEKTQNDQKEWMDLYGYTRRNEEHIRFPKGFLKLIFD